MHDQRVAIIEMIRVLEGRLKDYALVELFEFKARLY